MTRPSLFVRLMGAFVLVILVAIVVVSVIVNQTTTNEFRQFMFQGAMVRMQDLTAQLAAYYRARGSWDGVEALFAQGGQVYGSMSEMMSRGMMGGMMSASASSHVMLADARGIVIADTLPGHTGATVSPTLLATGTPIQVNGQTVGTLVVEGDMMNGFDDPAAQAFLNQVNRSLLLAGLAAGLIALALGFVLFRQITAPLNALANASDQIAAGDLHARADARGNDEIARVARSFNAMADHLARSETARRNMLADIAHELRNPIGVISSHLEAMMDGVFPLNPEQIASLHDETLLLARLVADLRELALADAGQLTLTRGSTDLGALVERAIAAFQVQAAEHQVTLTAQIGANIPLVNLDAQRIEQVLRNLLSNALRYTPPHGAVSVQLTREGNFARVQVRDTGAGIAPEDLPHVFERFWRADKSRSRAQGSVGLGLAIAKQWVEAHGGQIGVTSVPQQGSTFWFTLPL
jgi:signal transduction histidine kinase